MPRQWHAAVASGGGGLVSDSERTARRALVAVGRHGLGRASEKPLRLRRGSRHRLLSEYQGRGTSCCIDQRLPSGSLKKTNLPHGRS
jgi:hypothetical protein